MNCDVRINDIERRESNVVRLKLVFDGDKLENVIELHKTSPFVRQLEFEQMERTVE